MAQLPERPCLLAPGTGVPSFPFLQSLLYLSASSLSPQRISPSMYLIHRSAVSEKEGLSDLPDQATTRSLCRQLAVYHREDGFYLRPWSVRFLRKIAIHLPAQRSLRNTPTGLCRNNTLRPPALPNRPV